MHADFAIEREGTGTDKRRQLAGGTPPRQIHLEEAVLRVQKTERTSDVLARGAADRGDAEPIALDSHGRRESRELLCPIEERQAGSKAAACPECTRDAGDQDDEERREHYFEKTAHDARHVITTARTG